jgi:hypothetical protein
MFLNTLEEVIQKMQSKKKKLILCGDWNINFLVVSVRLRKLNNLLRMYNLVNSVASPARITKNSVTQIDIMVINKQVFKCPAVVLDLGFSDHLTQILKIYVNRSDRGLQIRRKRQFPIEGIKEFNYLLKNELWKDCLSNLDANASFKAFMDLILFLL